MPPPAELPHAAPTPGKPAYRIPLMSEIEASPLHGLRHVSTFSGCGGSCLGFRMAGWSTVWASEFVPAARETYLANRPGSHVDARDIRLVTAEQILEQTGLQKGELDVFEGSPPCASFSMAGKREKLWGQEKSYSDVRQRTDDLFAEYIRLLGGLMPRAFVAENVGGMVIGTSKGHFLEAVAAMRALGYRVGARLLDAQWLGVPQVRRRVIFVGIREDLGLDPPFPVPLPYRYSIRDALPWLDGPVVHDSGGAWAAGDITDQPSPTITNGSPGTPNSNHFKVHTIAYKGGMNNNEVVNIAGPAPTIMAGGIGGSASHQCLLRAPAPSIEYTGGYGLGKAVSLDNPAPTVMAAIGGVDDTQMKLRAPEPTAQDLLDTNFERFAIGPEWAKLAPGQSSDKFFSLVRPNPNTPVPTVTAGAGWHPGAAGVTHPSEPRKFTIAELRRLSGFPDDFILTGKYSQQWERLGRAVPPPMMAAVARELASLLLAYDAKKAGT